MGQKRDLPPSPDHRVDHEAPGSQPVDASRVSSIEDYIGKSTVNNAMAGLSSQQVGDFMMSLGTQDNINAFGGIPSSAQVREFMMSNSNHRPQPMMRPGAVPVGAFSDDEDAVNLDASEISDLPIVAHLAPNEADIEARITERVQHQINERLQERIRQKHVPSGNIIVADEVTDEPIQETKKRSKWIMISLVGLVVGLGIGGLVYWLLPDDGEQKPVPKVGPVAPSSAPSSSFSFDLLDPLVKELEPFIAPTKEDLFPFMDSTSPQSQALAWLQDDPIVLSAGRSTRTILERYVLAVLYYTTNGPSWNNHHLSRDDICTWNDQVDENAPVDTWNGVFCSGVEGTIEFLIVPDNNLVGPVPRELMLLTNLKIININFNRLSGSIPTQIIALTALESFGANTNRLKGGMPATFSPVMSKIDLSGNSLTGSLPESWGASMPALEGIDVSLNTISGSVPTTFGQLSKLLIFEATDNQLTGTIPAELGQLSMLETLSVRRNWLTGSLPSELDQLSSLESLDIAGNSFVGSLNKTVCGLPSLSYLRADCAEVDCPCCTLCCDDDMGGVCEDMTG